MGVLRKAKCRKCNKSFEVHDGGGFIFHMLRCDTCGKEKQVLFNKLGDLHFRYLMGLNMPYSMVTPPIDDFIRNTYPGKLLSENEYHRLVSEKVGKCRCGGNYTFDAPFRCPKCRSTEIDDLGGIYLYD